MTSEGELDPRSFSVLMMSRSVRLLSNGTPGSGNAPVSVIAFSASNASMTWPTQHQLAAIPAAVAG